MKIADYKEYEIYLPTSGGKAGKHAVTSHIQVRSATSIILHQFRFKVNDAESRQAAMKAAREFIDQRAKETKAA